MRCPTSILTEGQAALYALPASGNSREGTMSHHFPFPWGRTFLLRVILIILPVSLSCQKKDETPPPPTVAEVPVSSRSDTHSPDALSPVQGEGSNECCEVVANPELKGRMGRLIMQFPNGG